MPPSLRGKRIPQQAQESDSQELEYYSDIPDTTKKLQVYCSNGEVVTSDLGSITKNLLACAKKMKGKDVMAVVRAVFTQDDLREWLAAYDNRRPISPSRVQYMQKEHESGTWVEKYPNFTVDSDGEIANGGHTTNGMIAAGKDSYTLWFVLGVAPAMRTKIDDIKLRTVAQQAYYFDNLYDGLPDDNEARKSYASVAKFVLERFCKVNGYMSQLAPSIAREKIVQLEEGRRFWTEGKPHFVWLVERIKKSGNTTFLKGHFLSVGLTLAMAGYKKWANMLATGVGIDDESSIINLCRSYLLDNANPNRPDYRDSRVIKEVYETALCYLYAADTNQELRLPIQRKRLQRRGSRAGQYIQIKLSDKQIDADDAFRKQVVEYFVSKIKIPGFEPGIEEAA